MAACALNKAENWTKNSDEKASIICLLSSRNLERESAWFRHKIKQGDQDLEDAHIAGELHARGQNQDLSLKS